MHHSDGRKGQSFYLVEGVVDLGNITRQQGRFGEGRLEVCQVGAGSEGTTFPSNHEGFHRLIFARLGQRG